MVGVGAEEIQGLQREAAEDIETKATINPQRRL